jgi:biofilm protein TabA
MLRISCALALAAAPDAECDMAVFGSFSTVRERLAHDARFSAALAYAADLLDPGSAAYARIKAVAAGVTEKVELPDGAFALEQAYLTKPRPEGFFESHRKYIDVQVLVEGAEAIEVENIGRLAVREPFVPERDLIKYADSATASRLALHAGDAAVFFPVDGHMPSLQVDGRALLVRKVVVKVPAFPA